jgi:hypothetical protein
MASTAVSVATEDWKQLADAINGVNRITRAAISKEAKKHAISHHKDRKLQQLWKEISDAFA